MNATHVVQELQFDVEFETQDQAWEEQERLASFLQRTALQIVEEEFDHCSGRDEVLRLDVLSVDLGTLDLEELSTLGAQRLREQLRLALQAHRGQRQWSGGAGASGSDEGGQTQDEGVRWQVRADADLDALMHFLQSGRWPWHVSSAGDPVELAERVWQQRAPQLLQRLRALADPRTTLSRMARQMPLAWLRRLESDLLDRPPATLLPWQARPERSERRLLAALTTLTTSLGGQPATHQADRPAPPSRATERHLKAWLVDDAESLSAADTAELQTLWADAQRQDPAALRQLLNTLGVRASVRRRMARLWPQHLLRELLALYLSPTDAATVLAALQQAAQASPAAEQAAWVTVLRHLWTGGAEAHTALGPMLQSLRTLAAPSEAADAAEADPAEQEHDERSGWSRQAAERHLKALLADDAESLSAADAAELQTLWADAQRQDPAALRQLLNTLGVRASVRRRMARLWPQHLLRELLALYLSPTDAATVLAALQQAAQASPAAEQAAWVTVLRHLWTGGAEAHTVLGSILPAMLQELRRLDPAAGDWPSDDLGPDELVRALRAWWPEAQVGRLMALLAGAWPPAWLRLAGGIAGAEQQRLANRLAALVEATTVAPEPAQLVAWWWRECALRLHCSAAELALSLQLEPTTASVEPDAAECRLAWLSWWPDVKTILASELSADAVAETAAPAELALAELPLEARRADWRRQARDWARQRSLAAVIDRRELTLALSAWLPDEQAQALADLAFGALPHAWQGSADSPPVDAARRVQWCLQMLAETAEGQPLRAAELVRRWWQALALQQGRSPQELVRALHAEPADTADALRQQAWLGWLAADGLAAASATVSATATAPDPQPAPPLDRSLSLPSPPNLPHLQQVDLARLAQDSRSLQAWAAALPEAAWAEVWALWLPPADVPVLMQVLQTLQGLEAMALGDSPHAVQALRQQALMALLWSTSADLVTVVSHLVERRAWQADVPLPVWARRLQEQAAAAGGASSPLARLWGHWATERQVLDWAADPINPPDPTDQVLSRIVADLRGTAPDSAAPAILVDWFSLIRRSDANTAQARATLGREIEQAAAAHQLADRLAPGELLAVLAWLRPEEAGGLRAVWPQLRLLAPHWPVVARQLLRDRFEEDRPFEPEALLHRIERALRHGAARGVTSPATAATTASTTVTTATTATRPASEPWRFDEPADLSEPLFIANAGLVLLGPYLPRLFDMLGLLSEQRFIDEPAAERAVLLTQYAVTGRAAAPETELMLNKLLCGLPLDAPLPRAIELLPREQESIDGLLTAVIAHWSALGHTSIAGLRETFLQREGRLEHGDECWQLQVQPQTFDVLMDRLPWGYATLKFPWMPEVLHVEWR
ncbi:MAG: contractile injection system tape measure protein [Leptothrix sp. (in: b-proteobacteria)]